MQEFLIDDTPMYQWGFLYLVVLCGLLAGVAILFTLFRKYGTGALHPALWSRGLLGLFLTFGLSLTLWTFLGASGFSRVRVTDRFVELHRPGIRETIFLPKEDIADVQVKRVQRGRRAHQLVEITDVHGMRHTSILCIPHPDETKRLSEIVDSLKRILTDRGAVDHAAN